MGITSFTLNGLGVDAAASGVSGTVPRPRERVKGTGQDLGPAVGRSRLRGRNHQFLPDEEAIAIREGVFFQDCILRHAEASGDARERVPFAHDVALLLTRSWNRRRPRGSGDNRERWGRRQRWRPRIFPARCKEQDRRKCETGNPDRARLVSRGQNTKCPAARDADSSGHA